MDGLPSDEDRYGKRRNQASGTAPKLVQSGRADKGAMPQSHAA